MTNSNMQTLNKFKAHLIKIDINLGVVFEIWAIKTFFIFLQTKVITILKLVLLITL